MPASQSSRNFLRKIVLPTSAVLIGLEVTTELPSKGRSSKFYHRLADEYITPAMRRYLNPELAHDCAIGLSKYTGLTPRHRPSSLEQELNSTKIQLFPHQEGASKSYSLTLDHPVGLAAGFDKHGEIIRPMFDLGFASVEIGTVTPQPQPGNPSPRMFRLIQDHGIINRYGFNSVGATQVERNLQQYYEKGRHPSGVLGVNIGKNKTTQDARQDYTENIQKLLPYADYITINISSPNTEGLRNLQQATELRELLMACIEARNQSTKNGSPKKPLFVKLAPDLSNEELQDIVGVIYDLAGSKNSESIGLIVSNTTKARPLELLSRINEEGGLSGRPLKEKSTEMIRQLYRLLILQEKKGTKVPSIPIIGVGGIESGKDVLEKLKAGASAVQLYSSMIYQGPGVVSRIRDELAAVILEEHRGGMSTQIQDLIGLDHRP